MNDTSAEVSKIVVDHYRSITPAERWSAASSRFEMARKIVESSLPIGLMMEQRRLAIVRRLYGNELLEATLIAHAKYEYSTTSA